VKDALGGVQSVLVLGGRSELALATVRSLDVRPGGRVLLAGRDTVALEATANDLGRDLGAGVTVEVAGWDATESAGHAAFVGQAAAKLGGDIDLVLVAAGVLGDQDRSETDPAYAATVLDANFTGVAAALLAVAGQVRTQGHGTLVVFSSVAGLRARRANFVYGASKAGLDAFAEGLSAALAPAGGRVITVRPGFVKGRMTAGMTAAPFATEPEAVGKAVAAAVSGRRDVVYVPGILQAVFGVMRVLPRAVFRKLPG
jgi:decaprenylphospho-beta-D-erythro-pentofuranosid-2-ulose 2-reductase